MIGQLRRFRRVLAVALLAAVPAIGLPAATHADSGSSPNNVVQVVNQQDNTVQTGGHVQLNSILGSTVTPLNEAFAYSSCTSCGSYALAVQVDLYSTSATDIEPVNVAYALNYQCTACTTRAWAYQYVIPVNDPTAVPAGVYALVQTFNTVLGQVQNLPGASAAVVETMLARVVARFPQFLAYLRVQTG